MVSQFGLSESVGVIDLSEASGKQKDLVDTEVKKILDASYARAKECLTSNKRELDTLANALIKYESLSGDEIVNLLKGRKIDLKNRSQKPSRELKEITKPLDGEKSTGPAFGSQSHAPTKKN